MVSVRLRVDLEYDGTDFAGWQVQPGCRTVQGELTEAFRTILRCPVRIVGAGRTDAGVHARGQVAHLDVPPDVMPSGESAALASEASDSRDAGRILRLVQDGKDKALLIAYLNRLRTGVNALTGPDIAVKDVTVADEGFHARFSARARTYCYRVALRPVALNRKMVWMIRRELDRPLMEQALPHLVGRYPATSWCATHGSNRDAVVEVRSAHLLDESDGVLAFEITADRFVTHMVRTIVGTLVEVGCGKRSPEGIRQLIEARDRRLAGPTAPACGLCLEHVDY